MRIQEKAGDCRLTSTSPSFTTTKLLPATRLEMATKAAAVAVDFARIYTSLGLGKETISSLQAFRKRNSEALRLNAQYASQPTSVDLTYYRSILKNKAVVDEAEKLLKEFKPVTYDVGAHVKAIEAFETKAVEKAKETEAKIDVELQELQATLANIEDARPFDQLTVDEVGKAHPRIVEVVETMLKKGKWTVPGYKEKFGDLNLM
ncbi:ATP synthase subunit d, mitochondrial [Hypsizygus marmoreus]|uniref:ATP synthase subunit d, mitochondrial n=1 Tax=Hypsizygus marmoreus TaxID=39966 RepID=A0A369JIR0_HYPMA|nr:ATP synthase subunit d, mitochondrial [Hypsizygus marmoreus]